MFSQTQIAINQADELNHFLEVENIYDQKENSRALHPTHDIPPGHLAIHPEAPHPASPPQFQIFAVTIKNKSLSIDTNEQEQVHEVIAKIGDRGGIPNAKIILSYEQTILELDKQLKEYNIQKHDNLRNLRGWSLVSNIVDILQRRFS